MAEFQPLEKVIHLKVVGIIIGNQLPNMNFCKW